MGHVVYRFRWSVNRTGDTRIPPGPPGEVLEIGTRFVLVALQAVVEAAVGLVERLVRDVGQHADRQALLPRVFDVIQPNLRAHLGETEFFQTVHSVGIP